MLSITPDFEEFQKLSETYNLIPIYTELPADLETPITLFYKLFEEDHTFLLESLEGSEKWARYSFLGLKPFLKFRSKGKKIYLEDEGGVRSFEAEPYPALKKIVSSFKVPQVKELPRFWGGAVGYVSYEMVSFFEPRVRPGRDVLGFFDMNFVFPEVLLIYDRLNHSIKVVGLCRVKDDPALSYDRTRDLICEVALKIKGNTLSWPSLKKGLSFSPEIEKEEFLSWVKHAKEYIGAGDVIQVVLSQRFCCEDEVLYNPHTSFYLYRALRKINPSPYMFYLRFGDEILIGSSPEILVRLEGRRVETRPIAGTRRRGFTEEEDLALEKELKSDEKELAEHIMLVDLGRNDLGRICEYGSVEVHELMVVERYSHVMHLVSGVRGRLAEGRDMFDTFSAVFPAGTVSGAPKIRAMEIITELEKTVRGPYAGAVGYFGFSGNMDFCITIRTLFQKGKRLYLQAGAGIVADSRPEKEYEETLNKAKGMKKALELFGKGYFL